MKKEMSNLLILVALLLISYFLYKQNGVINELQYSNSLLANEINYLKEIKSIVIPPVLEEEIISSTNKLVAAGTVVGFTLAVFSIYKSYNYSVICTNTLIYALQQLNIIKSEHVYEMKCNDFIYKVITKDERLINIFIKTIHSGNFVQVDTYIEDLKASTISNMTNSNIESISSIIDSINVY